MRTTFLAALALIGLAACSGDTKGQPAAGQRRATAPATSQPTTTKAKTKPKAGARPDTTTQRNPLTNR